MGFSMTDVRPPTHGNDWVALTADRLPVEMAIEWVTLPECGAQVVFSGTVRDHAEGRSGVSSIEYEAYTEQVETRLADIARQARDRWPMLGRIALLHRVGVLLLGECSVLVVVSAPHRAEAFESARWSIDALKETVPIWKRETWEGGVDWGTGAHDLAEIAGLGPDGRD
jgi:molybdopterin synthase catalytic subunit